ncbi:MAG: hypothetical protein NZ555_11240 [Geminicoccaceae bacterium]|nr:hypothetical protein [Geminicoccaceae bacterium]
MLGVAMSVTTGSAPRVRWTDGKGETVLYRFPSVERLASRSAHALTVPPNPLSGTAVNELPGASEAEAVRAEWRGAVDPAYLPARTELGALLRELRRVALAANPRLLGWDDIEAIMDDIRGRERRS